MNETSETLKAAMEDFAQELQHVADHFASENVATDAAVETPAAEATGEPFRPLVQHFGANRHDRRARKHEVRSSQKWYTTPNFSIRKRTGV